MPRLIMRAGTVHVLLLSWQNQSPSCCERTQTGSCHIATAGVRLSLRTPTSCQEKHFVKSVMKTSNATSYSVFTQKTSSNITAHLPTGEASRRSAPQSEATSLTSRLISGALLQITIQNWWIVASVHTGCSSNPPPPPINVSDFPPTLRMDFLLNDAMRKNYSYKFEASTACY